MSKTAPVRVQHLGPAQAGPTVIFELKEDETRN